MLFFEVILLAVVQGVGEFLPISSSGHVVVLEALFDQIGSPLQEKLLLNVVLHLGTLLVILVYYWRRIGRLFTEERRTLALLAAATLPAAVIGLLLKVYCQSALENPLLTGFMFPLTGAMLLWTARRRPGSLTCGDLTFAKAVVIGMFQAVAILPGISRSGATIVAGLGAGLKREEAAAFSFLLAIPAIAGAGLLEVVDLWRQPSEPIPPRMLLLGAVVSFVVGMACLGWLLRWLRQGRLHYFAWWLFLLGAAVLIWRFTG